MAVPNIFANVTTSIPLSQLDTNFATAITLGNTAVYLGNTTTTLGNLTLTNVTLSSGTNNIGSTSISNGTSNVSIASSGGNITMATGGSNAVIVTTGQNVGIGTTTPARKLEVSAGGSTAARFTGTNPVVEWVCAGGTNTNFMLAAQSNVGDAFEITPSTTAGGTTFTTPAIVVKSDGNVGIGTNSPTARLQVERSSSSADVFAFKNTSATTPSGGRFDFTAAAPNSIFQYFLVCNDNAAQRFAMRSDGGLANYSANNVNLSDRQEKKDFLPAKSYLETICAIPVQTFNYIDQTDELPNLGVVAQDVQAVAPELVSESDWSTEKDGSKMRLSVYQTDLQYALMKSIQELKTLNDTLTARIVALESK